MSKRKRLFNSSSSAFLSRPALETIGEFRFIDQIPERLDIRYRRDSSQVRGRAYIWSIQDATTADIADRGTGRNGELGTIEKHSHQRAMRSVKRLHWSRAERDWQTDYEAVCDRAERIGRCNI